jgi:hypothetical protein
MQEIHDIENVRYWNEDEAARASFVCCARATNGSALQQQHDADYDDGCRLHSDPHGCSRGARARQRDAVARGGTPFASNDKV